MTSKKPPLKSLMHCTNYGINYQDKSGYLQFLDILTTDRPWSVAFILWYLKTSGVSEDFFNYLRVEMLYRIRDDPFES